MNIVVLDGYTLNPGDLSWEEFKALGNFVCYDRTPAHQVVERIGECEIVLTNKTVISREILDNCKNVKYIGVLATGFNVVDIEAALEKGIVVTNIPDYSTNTVAQFVFALLMEACHNVKVHSDSVFSGDWVNSADFSYCKTPQIELFGKTLGILGYGKIGKRVAEIAVAFGMKVLANNRSSKIDESAPIEYASVDRLFKESDFISLNCPLTAENQGIINTENINNMKEGVIIVNTARGPLVNEQDMLDALKSGKVMCYATDVLSIEPPNEDNPLLKAENCIITPHIAWTANDARNSLMSIAVGNLEAFLKGCPVNTVN